jgi:hypothetical protein
MGEVTQGNDLLWPSGPWSLDSSSVLCTTGATLEMLLPFLCLSFPTRKMIILTETCLSVFLTGLSWDFSELIQVECLR